jgi:hypothetical protein
MADPAAGVSSSSTRDDPAEQHPSPLPACLRPYLLSAQVCTTPRALSAVQQPLPDNKPGDGLRQQQRSAPAAAGGMPQPQESAGRDAAQADSRAACATTSVQVQPLQGSACSDGPGEEEAAVGQHPWDPSSGSSSLSAAASQNEEPVEALARQPLHAVPQQQQLATVSVDSSEHGPGLCILDRHVAGKPAQKVAGGPQRRNDISVPLPGLPVQEIKQVRHVPRLLFLSAQHLAAS